VLNKDSFTRVATALAKHIHGNALQYVTMIGSIAQEDYSTAATCLAVLVLRSILGAIQRNLNKRKRTMTTRKPDQDKQ